MSTPKLPKDLAAFPMWSARLGLTPIVAGSVENILEAKGDLFTLPGQRMKYVSEAVAMRALESFVERAGIQGAMHDAAAVRREEARMRKHIANTVARDTEKLK